MSISESEHYDLLARLAAEFVERIRRGEAPTLEQYTDRHPELADDIRDLFPAMVQAEQADGDRKGGEQAEDHRATHPPLSEVGDYRILREIGRGGMGVVYEAEQISLGRRVALKVLPRQASGDRMVRERFRREARAAAKLHHTNIVPVFEVGQDRDVRFYAMQLIQGQGLDLVINELRRLRDCAGSEPTTGVVFEGPPAGHCGRALARLSMRLHRTEISSSAGCCGPSFPGGSNRTSTPRRSWKPWDPGRPGFPTETSRHNPALGRNAAQPNGLAPEAYRDRQCDRRRPEQS